MKFLVQLKVFEAMCGPDADVQVRQGIGGAIPKIMQSGKVTDGGFLTDRRGAYMVLNAENAEDLYGILGPEVFSTCNVQVSPVASFEAIGGLFQQWAQQGR